MSVLCICVSVFAKYCLALMFQFTNRMLCAPNGNGILRKVFKVAFVFAHQRYHAQIRSLIYTLLNSVAILYFLSLSLSFTQNMTVHGFSCMFRKRRKRTRKKVYTSIRHTHTAVALCLMFTFLNLIEHYFEQMKQQYEADVNRHWIYINKQN